MRSVVWPTVGHCGLIDQDEPTARPGEVTVDVHISVLSPGTERAVFLGLPTACCRFPQYPGYMAAGSVRQAGSIDAGTLVAVRRAGHRSVAVVPQTLVRRIPAAVNVVDAATWQLALTALYGLTLGRLQPGEPVVVVGAGLLGVMTRRLAAACGASTVWALARTEAKAWGARPEATTRFVAEPELPERAPLVLDVTGSAAGLAKAASVTASGGRVVLVGSPRAMSAAVPLQEIYDRRLLLVGAHISNLDESAESGLTDRLFAFLAEGRFSILDVMEIHPASEAPAVYERLAGDPALIGAALRWDSGARGRGGDQGEKPLTEPSQRGTGLR